MINRCFRNSKARLLPFKGRSGLAWISIFVIFTVTRLPLLDIPLDRDEGAFGLIAQSILRGELPYQDIFDHKPPGVFYIYAFLLLLLPSTASGVHLFLHIWNFGSLLLVNSVASNLFNRKTGLFAALVYTLLSGAPSVQGFSASTENFLLLPMLGSIALVIAPHAGSGRQERLFLILSGALGATSCWIKPVAFFPLLIVPLIILLENRRSGRKASIYKFSLWLSGGLILSFFVCLPFLLIGVWDEFYYWSFQHNMLYSAESWSGEIAGKMLSLQIPRLTPDFAVPGILSLFGILLAFRQGQKNAITASVLLPLSITGAAFSGYFYNHYFSIMTPAISILAAFFATSISETQPFSGRSAKTTLFIAVLFTLSTILLRPWYWINPDPYIITRRVLGKNSFEAAPLISKYLKKRVKADQSIYIDGSEPQIAFLASRRNVSPFVMSYPLTKPWKRNREFQQKTWNMIEREKPEYIVVSWITTSRAHESVEPFLEKKLADLVDSSYTLDSVVLERPEGDHSIRKGPFLAEEITEFRPDIRFILWRKREPAF